MAAKRGTKGDYVCHVPKGGHRHGCGAGNKVRELERKVEKLTQHIKVRDKTIAKEVAKRLKASKR